MRFIVDAKDPGHNVDVLKLTRFSATWRVYGKILAAAQEQLTKLPYSQPRITGSQINAGFSLLLLPLVLSPLPSGAGLVKPGVSPAMALKQAHSRKCLSLVS
jgi:hypothetical protein